MISIIFNKKHLTYIVITRYIVYTVLQDYAEKKINHLSFVCHL